LIYGPFIDMTSSEFSYGIKVYKSLTVSVAEALLDDDADGMRTRFQANDRSRERTLGICGCPKGFVRSGDGI
jgi:hypothetical protein